MTRLLDDDGIRGVVLDSYGTLFDVQSVTERCDEIFPGAGAGLALLWRRKQLEYTWLLTIMNRYEDFAAVNEHALLFAVKALDLSLSLENRDFLLESYLQLEYFSEAAEALADMSPYRLALLSNGTLDMLNALLTANHLTGIFDAVVSADEVRAYKPDAKLYLEVQKRLDVAPSRLLLASCHAFDVTGAKSCGMRACWVNREGGQWDALGFLPDMTVGDLRELVEILNA